MSGAFERTCPGCGITIRHSRKNNRDQGIRNGAKCKSCSRLGETKSGMLAKGQGHHRAISGFLRDPFGRLHKFHNLTQFVRDNLLLFAQQDIVYRRPKKTKPGSALKVCNASKSLHNLVRPNSRRTTWKGWTVPTPCRDTAAPLSCGRT